MYERERLGMAFQWTGLGNLQLFKVVLDFHVGITYAPVDSVSEEVGDPGTTTSRGCILHGWLYDAPC